MPTPRSSHPTTNGPRRRRSTTLAALAATAGATVLATSASAVAAGPPAQDPGRPPGAKLQAILDHGVASPDRPSPGIAVYVHRDGHGTWSGAAGKARIKPAQPMGPGMRFRAGSIVKTFVAVATLQLAEEGRFSLDAPLTAVLPSRVTARFAGADRITVRMLLNHTSGLPEWDDEAFDRNVALDPHRRYRVGELLDRAATMPYTGAPGERFSYSNTDYTLLGRVIEQATGKSWRSVIRARIVRPLHLRHTSLPRPGTIQQARDIAHGYHVIDGRRYDTTYVDSSMAGAAGGQSLLTTDADLSRFLHAVLAGRLFAHRATLHQMLAWVPTPPENGRVAYGLGIERYVLPNGVEVIGHMGTGAGYRAFMFRLRAQHVDFSMITNEPGDPLPVLLPALDAIVAASS
jgi:D-alanyl-D-alanine carboxypeptidase